MKHLIGFLFCCLYVLPVLGQRSELVKATNTRALQQFIQQRSSEIKQQKKAALELAQRLKYPTYFEAPDGSVFQLKQLSSTGLLQYYSTFNNSSAVTISTDKVWPGGTIGFNLSGAGFTLGEWDSGAILAGHSEFNGRVTQVDSATNISQHATHVAGTMIATGINNKAKGMAYQAKLRAFDWEDDEAEMAREAANGLLVSNHSYGFIGGWNHNGSKNRWEWWGDVRIDSLTDCRFGFYDNQARDWDQISYLAPYYLILKAAGNDRNHTGPASGTEHYVFVDTGWVASTATRNPDGPYDCMTGAANAKNVLTIGAVSAITSGYTDPSSVKMSSFSAWGPTDDGRIKPDLVTNGVSVYSTNSNSTTTYLTSSGTSMASPSAAGSLLLLQQHYANRKKGRLMRAATLKALAIHSADEAGTAPGPDYSYGWGLLNIARAADLISKDSISSFIQELTLTQSEVINIIVNADPDQVLNATLCWTDPAGTPGAPALNSRRKLLVNDLDLRIINASNFTQHLPWKLNVEQPDLAATKADNDVDNVENVQVQNPGSGTYIIRISHKGLLSNIQQDFSLIVSGIKMDNQQTCRDTVVYNASNGRFDDGSGSSNYADNADCFWKIQLPSPGTVALKFDSLALAPDDIIRIYDGETANAPLLRTISANSSIADSIYSSSNALLLRFTTDAQGNNKGWLAGYNSCTQPYTNFTSSSTSTTNMYEFKNYSFNAESYVWYYGNGDSSVTTAATHNYTYSSPGSYTVTLVARNKCSSQSISKELGTNTVVVTSAPAAADRAFRLYPNPSKGEFTLAFENIKPQHAALQIYNLQGQTVHTESLQLKAGTYQQHIAMPGGQLPGLYILRLTLDKEVITKKIIIE